MHSSADGPDAEPPHGPTLALVILLPPPLQPLVHHQDGLLTRDQAGAGGLSSKAVRCRTGRYAWQELLPGVLLTRGGAPTRRQLMVAARLWAGPESAIDSVDACPFHGLWLDPEALTEPVRVAVPLGCNRRSQGFVSVRRSTAPLRTVQTDLLRYVDRATAVVVASRTLSPRAGAALLARALQQGLASYEDLLRAHAEGPPRGRQQTVDILGDLAVGIRSPAESAFRALLTRNRRLPEPLWNCVLRLPDGSHVSPDALWPDAALVHEVNGMRWHAWGLDFEEMQRRHDRLTAAGLTVLHNTPRRIERDGGAVLDELELSHRRYAGRGLPAGVEIVSTAMTMPTT